MRPRLMRAESLPWGQRVHHDLGHHRGQQIPVEEQEGQSLHHVGAATLL